MAHVSDSEDGGKNKAYEGKGPSMSTAVQTFEQAHLEANGKYKLPRKDLDFTNLCRYVPPLCTESEQETSSDDEKPFLRYQQTLYTLLFDPFDLRSQ